MLRVEVESFVPAALASGKEDPAAVHAQPVAFISARGTELCVVCHTDTGVPVQQAVDTRAHYVAGVGQCCEHCSSEW
ncbi:MAG: hypothetical protein NW223_22415 [Hyphomicrobiaceae bacterium]|nr:hypothetical protein [Hyphomicrobiaceae bacterium]